MGGLFLEWEREAERESSDPSVGRRNLRNRVSKKRRRSFRRVTRITRPPAFAFPLKGCLADRFELTVLEFDADALFHEAYEHEQPGFVFTANDGSLVTLERAVSDSN